jgi:putative ABC transport system permease protein
LLLRFAVEGLTAQPGRSLLTVLGMAIGTASVVVVVSIGLVGREYVVSLIEGVGSNLVIAYGTGDGVNPEEISFEDIDVFKKQVPGIRAIAPVLGGGDTLYIGGKAQPVSVLGVTPAFKQVRNLVMVSGRFFSEHEEASGAKVCVITEELAQRLFPGEDVRGGWVRFFNLRFRVLGVYREAVESAAAVGKSEAAGLVAMVPFSTLRNLSDVRYVDVVYIQSASARAVAGVMQGVRNVLAARHRTLESFRVESLEQYLILAQQVSDAVTLGLMGIAAVSLLVAGIGIMNIMMVTVTERTSDIGIRLALGAGRRAVLVQFLMEASILSLVGGALGIALGAGIPLYAGVVYEVHVPISLASVGVAFGVSVAVGLFFGLYPARKAAGMNIVDALGYQ